MQVKHQHQCYCPLYWTTSDKNFWTTSAQYPISTQCMLLGHQDQSTAKCKRWWRNVNFSHDTSKGTLWNRALSFSVKCIFYVYRNEKRCTSKICKEQIYQSMNNMQIATYRAWKEMKIWLIFQSKLSQKLRKIWRNAKN